MTRDLGELVEFGHLILTASAYAGMIGLILFVCMVAL